jgi:excisionase family DNA binding protein
VPANAQFTMPHRLLSAEEAARYLHLGRAEFDRLVRDGQIPSELRGGRRVFRLVDIDAWASRRILEAEPRDLAQLNRPATPAPGPAAEAVRLADLVQPELVAPALAAKTRASVLREMVALVDRAGWVCDARALLETLEAREALCPTAVPGGVAFLHPRSPQPDLFVASLLALGRTVQPIYFGAPDGRPTDLFFLLGCREEALHLRLLARLCLMAQKTDLLEQLRAAPAEPEALLRALLDAEAAALAAVSRAG